MLKPSSFMEKSFYPSSYMERTCDVILCPRLPVFKPCKHLLFLTILPLRVELLVPASFMVSEAFSMSLCLLTVTKLSPPEMLVVVTPTHRLLACGNFNSCLRDFMACLSAYLCYYFAASLDAFNLVVVTSDFVNFQALYSISYE